MTCNVADWKSHVTRQLNNMQIERQQWIALRGVICPVESATGSQCASMHGHWVSMKPFGLLPPIPNIQTPLMDYSSVRVLSVHFELMNLNFLYTLWLHQWSKQCLPLFPELQISLKITSHAEHIWFQFMLLLNLRKSFKAEHEIVIWQWNSL